MKIEIPDQTIKRTSAAIGLFTGAIGLFLIFDNRFITEVGSQTDDLLLESKLKASVVAVGEEVSEVAEKIDATVLAAHQRLLMGDSARYAEVAKYYHDLEKERPLLKAEKARLALVEKQQERIAKQLLETTDTQ